MFIEIDFQSEEAIYSQLVNQIVYLIATNQINEGDSLPSVRQLADNLGINMHTVNKAYTILKQDGFVKVDRRKGAVIEIDVDHLRALREMRQAMQLILARGSLSNITRAEAHAMIDEIYGDYGV